MTRFASIALFAALMTACGSDEDKTTGDSGGTTDTTDTTAACFTTCADFCTAAIATCEGTYADETTCLDACAAWPCGTEGDQGGNSLACRDTHLGLAETDPTTHCPHAAADGGGVCVD